MKPVGLVDPNTGHRPWACVQLRRENSKGTMFNLVGFQTNLKFGEQKRVFRMIPGLENAEFVRYGVMHRNSFMNSPELLKPTYQSTKREDLFFAGQMTGVEGYVESAASGLLAGINAARLAKEMEPVETQIVEIMPPDIENLIYVVRNKQVMVDSDLAMLYQVETGALNRAVKRNIARFPEDFRFQLTKDEYENLKCQFGTSNGSGTENGYGGRRTLPYVFTEQGISMLASVLHSEVAINVSIGIMRAFVEMRRFIANNALLFERISNVELKQLEYQKKSDEKLEQIFEYISDHEESNQKIFFDGQIYDAFSLLIELIQKAETEIVLVDGYVDVGTLNILSKKKENVAVTVYTLQRTKLSQTDIDNFNAQYPKLDVKYTRAFHDRFLILDKTKAYHVGASLKDAGKKCFGINLIEDAGIVRDILQRVELETEE